MIALKKSHLDFNYRPGARAVIVLSHIDMFQD